MTPNVRGLPQAVESNDTSGLAATTNIIYKKRRGQHDAGLRQTICCLQPYFLNHTSALIKSASSGKVFMFDVSVNKPRFLNRIVPIFVITKYSPTK